MRRNLKYIFLLAAGFALLLLVEWFRPAPLDWSMNFSRNSKIPFGGYVPYRLLPEIFPGRRISVATLPIYNTLRAEADDAANYIFINDTFGPGTLDVEGLLDFAAAGNAVFVAAHNFRGKLADTLRLRTDLHGVFNDSIGINFVNPALRRVSPYVSRQQIGSYYFTGFDTLRATVLGLDTQGRINFIKLAWEPGAFFLSTVPLAFTNYNMLYRDNAAYVCGAFSYLPAQTTIWDEYYKAGRDRVATPLRFVLSQEPLRWAYFVALAAAVLFIVFEGRRRQRLIPLLPPRTNTTLEFMETVGRLYFQHGDHKNLAEKKITHFLDYIRSHFYLPTTALDQAWCEKLAEKTGIAVAEISALTQQIHRVRAPARISEAELTALNEAVERFYRRTGPRQRTA